MTISRSMEIIGLDLGCQGAFHPPIVVVAKSAWLHFRLAAKIAPAPLLLLSPQEPLRLRSCGGPVRSCRKENGPHPQGVCRIRKRQSRQRLRNARSKRKERLAPNLRIRASWLKCGGCSKGVPPILRSPTGARYSRPLNRISPRLRCGDRRWWLKESLFSKPR